MSPDRTNKWIPSVFQVAAAGIGALVAGPLGGAIGGFLGHALGDTLSSAAAKLTEEYTKKFGEEAGKKLYEIGVGSVSERLKPSAPSLAALYREALRRSFADIKLTADSSVQDWFEHWDVCLNSPDPPSLDEFGPDQLDVAKLGGFLHRTMETLDGIGLAHQQKIPSINPPTRPLPDTLFEDLTKLLPTVFKNRFQELIVKPANEQAWNEAQLIFQDWLTSTLTGIAAQTSVIDATTKAILELVKDKPSFEEYKKSIQPEIPYEIASPVSDFTDRVADLKELFDACGKRRTILLFGEPGLGKTELARRLAAEIGDKYPHGHIYVDLKGTTASPLQAAEILSLLIQKFGLRTNGEAAVTLDNLANRYLTVTHGKQMLLFLDNAFDSEQVGHIGPPLGCLLVVASHRKLALAGAAARELSPLSIPDSVAFLNEAVPGIGAPAADIAALCGGLPFALRKAAGYLTARPDIDPAEYARDLGSRTARNSLAESVIGTSYDLLSTAELKEQWCALSCFADPFSREAMEAIWELSPDAGEPIIDLLMKSCLLHYDRVRRCYYMHDLDCTFAQVHLEHAQPYLCRHAAYFFRKLLAQRHPLELADALAGEVFATWEYCERERKQRGIGSAIPVAREILGAEEITAASAIYLVARLFKRKHRFDEAQEIYDTCRQVAANAGYTWLEGACLRSVGEIHWIRGDQPSAGKFCDLAIDRLSAGHDYESRKELIFTLHLNSERQLKEGEFREAEKTARDSMHIRDRIPPYQRESTAGLSNGAIKLIAFLLQRNDLEGANKLLVAERQNLEGLSLASTLGQVGSAMSDAGRYDEADALFEDALCAYEGNDVGKAWIHRCLAELEFRRGNLLAARSHVEQALSICAARNLQVYEAYQVALTLIVAIRFYHLAGEAEPVTSLAPRLTELYGQMEPSSPSAKRKVAFALAGLEETLLKCGLAEEASSARAQRSRFEESIQRISDVELLADRWGCDALALAWPGQLLRLLTPSPQSNAKATRL